MATVKLPDQPLAALKIAHQHLSVTCYTPGSENPKCKASIGGFLTMPNKAPYTHDFFGLSFRLTRQNSICDAVAIIMLTKNQ